MQKISALAAFVLFLLSSPSASAGFKATLKTYGTAGAFPGLIQGGEYVVRIDWTQNQNGGGVVPWIAKDFFSFCIERSQDVYFGRTYDYTLKNLERSPDPNPVGTTGMGSTKANQLSRLWAIEIGGDGKGGMNQLGNDNTKNAAFQQAIWGILDSTYLTSTQYMNNTTLAFKALVSGYIDESKTAGKKANLIALTGGGWQDQIVEIKDGYYYNGSDVVPTPVPPALVLAFTGVIPLLGFRRFLRSAA